MLLINVKEEKRRLRARYKKLRAQCPKDVKLRLDSALTAKVLGTEEYKSCETLFIRSALRRQVGQNGFLLHKILRRLVRGYVLNP